jgi:hypothetical protein
MFFLVPDDLTNLDIQNGNCWNTTIMQNVTFGIQDEALGIHGNGAGSLQSNVGSTFALAVSMFVSIILLV